MEIGFIWYLFLTLKIPNRIRNLRGQGSFRTLSPTQMELINFAAFSRHCAIKAYAPDRAIAQAWSMDGWH